MKKTYHLCLSAGDEVMFRDLEDYNRGFNCLALALYKTDSTGLVESFMSTHSHQLSQTSDPVGLMYHFRLAYSMYFNRKYHRQGKLGEDSHFTMEVVGYNHTLAAASYVLRNALHHGVAPLPYAYPHCSANSIFMAELGKTPCSTHIDRRHYRKHIGKTAEYPDSYKMNENGKANYRKLSDIDICTEIDRNILPQYGKPSVYMLSRQEKQKIAEHLYRNLHIPEEQIKRCLA